MKHDFNHIRSHSFRGKNYRVVWRKPRVCADGDSVGFCECPTDKGREFWVWPKQDAEELLATVLHEAFHATQWDVNEEVAEDFERDTMRLLRRMGLRVSFEPETRK